MIEAAGVTAALPLATCIDLMADALRAFDRRDVVQPMRSVIQLPDGSGSLYTMPAFIAEPRALAVKLITIFHGNEGGPLPTHQGVVVVFDPHTGAPALLLDAARLTAIRTAAVSAVATRSLARPGATVLAVLGTGVQARSHIEAMPLVRPIREVHVWGRSTGRAQQLARTAEESGLVVTVHDNAEDAVSDADIVCTTTSAREPVLHGKWLKPGTHINAVGASTADAREVDGSAVGRARVFVDSIDAALTEAGDLLIPMREGITHAKDWTPLGAVLNGNAAGRTSDDDITLFKSLGLAIEDAAAAAHIARQQPAPGGG
jgi:ornithine cyclodeaminase